MLTRWMSYLRGLRHRRRSEAEAHEELQFHVENETAANIARGMAPDEARRVALRDLGGLVHTHDAVRRVRFTPLDSIGADLSVALRRLLTDRVFTTAAVLVLALGIGASTALFSAVDAIVLRGLPFDDEGLVAVGTVPPFRPGGSDSDRPRLVAAAPAVDAPVLPGPVTHQDFLDWEERQTVFTGLAAYAASTVALADASGVAEETRALRVSVNFFDVLRVVPHAGRTFGQEHDSDAQTRPAVISYGLWQRRFGGTRDTIGRSIQIDGAVHEIIGVTPPRFVFPVTAAAPIEVWVPLVTSPEVRTRTDGGILLLQALGRLRHGVTLDLARTQMRDLAQTIAPEHPAWRLPGSSASGTLVVPFPETVVGERTSSWLLLLLGAALLVLLIVCANVAALALARASARQREIVIRAATGASRWRIVRHLLIENLTLWLMGAMLGLALARWGIDAIRAALPDGIARADTIALDLRVAAVTMAATVVTGIVFGLIPALQCSRPDLTRVLHGGGTPIAGSRQRTRAALVALQLALAVILLVGAGLFTASFARVMSSDLGFDPGHVLIATVALPESYADDSGFSTLDAIERRLRLVTGVEHVAAGSGTIPLGSSWRSGPASRPHAPSELRVSTSIASVTPDYHRVMRIPLIHGRYLEPADDRLAERVVLIDETAAAVLFPGEEALDRTIVLSGEPRRVVGVVGVIRHNGYEADVYPAAYVPMADGSDGLPRGMDMPADMRSTLEATLYGRARLLVRTTADPLRSVPAINAAVQDVLPGEPLRNIDTLAGVAARLTAQRRVSMLLMNLFGLLGLIVAAVGIYGVVAYTASQRAREIGVRMALGASRIQVMASMLWRSTLLIVIGLGLGSAGAWWLGSTASAYLYQTEVTDPRIFARGLLALASAALAASAIPAYRAATQDPSSVLRPE